MDVKKQKIIKKIETPYEQLHGKIENVLNMSESNKFLILDKMRGGRELVR